MTHLADRYCKNPACGERFTPRRSDQIYHTSGCRSEAGRLRDEGITTRKAWKASQPVPERPQTARKPREPTTYVVFEVIESFENIILTMQGVAVEHKRERAVAKIRASSAELLDARLVAIPGRSIEQQFPPS